MYTRLTYQKHTCIQDQHIKNVHVYKINISKSYIYTRLTYQKHTYIQD